MRCLYRAQTHTQREGGRVGERENISASICSHLYQSLFGHLNPRCERSLWWFSSSVTDVVCSVVIWSLVKKQNKNQTKTKQRHRERGAVTHLPSQLWSGLINSRSVNMFASVNSLSELINRFLFVLFYLFSNFPPFFPGHTLPLFLWFHFRSEYSPLPSCIPPVCHFLLRPPSPCQFGSSVNGGSFSPNFQCSTGSVLRTMTCINRQHSLLQPTDNVCFPLQFFFIFMCQSCFYYFTEPLFYYRLLSRPHGGTWSVFLLYTAAVDPKDGSWTVQV